MNETLTRTICIKLDVDGHEAILQETQRRFNAAANWVASLCWEEHITNSNTAHHRVYGQTRARFGLGAQLAICARAKALEAIKAIRAQDAEKLARRSLAQARRKSKGKPSVPPCAPARCPQFGERANRHSQASFRCQQCGFCGHADYNAAVNISLAAGQAANGDSGTSLVTSPRL